MALKAFLIYCTVFLHCLTISSANAQTTFDQLFSAMLREAMRSSGNSETRIRAPNEVRWLVVASRGSSQEAITVAETFASTVGPALVVRSRNGVYAVVLGLLHIQKAEQNLQALKDIRLIPQDAFLSSGNGLAEVIWDSFPAGASLDVMNAGGMQRTVARLQQALKQLGLYDKEVDGLVGSGTIAAMRGYAQKFGPLNREFIDANALSSIEQAAIDGFASDTDRHMAQRAGFRDNTSWRMAQEGGFASRADYDAAHQLGFATYGEYQAFRTSGFVSKSEYLNAQSIGYSDRRSYDEHRRVQLERQKQMVGLLVDDVQQFLKLNPDAPNVLEIAQAVAALREVEGGADLDRLMGRAEKLRNGALRLDGFAAFERARAEERAEARRLKQLQLATELADLQAGARRWMAFNLTHQAAGELAKELSSLDASAAELEVEQLDSGLQRLRALLSRHRIDVVTEIANQLSSPGGGQTAFRITRTEANSFLLEGAADEHIFLYNSSAQAPSVMRNLVGQFEFEKGVAQVCAFPEMKSPAFRRAILSGLSEMGAARLAWSLQACRDEDLLQHDLVVLHRREFLKAQPSLVVAVLDLIESNRLRLFEPLNHNRIEDQQRREDEEKRRIADAVMKDGINGYGALATAGKGRGLCVSIAEDELVHKSMLNAIILYMRTIERDPSQPKVMLVEEAFRGLQREECGVFYAQQNDLKMVAGALMREKTEYEFLPIWFESVAIREAEEALTTERLEKTKQEEERRLRAAEDRRLRELQSERDAATVVARRAALRRQYGQEARALQTLFQEGLEIVVLAKRPNVNSQPDRYLHGSGTEFFPAFLGWQADLPRNMWTPQTLSTSVEEYGLADWKSRPLEVIVLKATFNLMSRERGEYTSQCFLLGFLLDQEFDVLRDGLEADCADSAALTRWVEGHKIKSRWNPSSIAIGQ